MTDDLRNPEVAHDAELDPLNAPAADRDADVVPGNGPVTESTRDAMDRDDADRAEADVDVRPGRVPSPAPDVADVEFDAVTVVERADSVERPRRRLHERVVARLVRRPVGWWNRPWTNDRIARVLVTSTALTITTVVIMRVVHFNPIPGFGSQDLILDRTTPTGGDMGAHVWAPAYLRDHLLPHGEIQGWSMDWYGGLPLYRFYMVIPALAIVALDVVLPYGIAFKLVAISGLVAFPAVCWAFGRLSAMRHPIPELFAFGGMCFLLDESFEIYGGNVKSTMAGEFSFSIALTLAVLGLGLLSYGLRTGRFRVWAAVVLSLAAVSHGIVLIFVAVAATVLCLVWIDRTRIVYALTVGITTVLLSAWWVGPFLFGHEFMTDMKYGFRPNSATDSFWDMYFPLTPALDIIITSLAVLGLIAFVVRRELTGVALGLICIVFTVLVWNTRGSLPVIGLLWNPRLLPFVYLTRYLLMVVGAYELISWIVNAGRNRLANRPLSAFEGAGAFAVIVVSVLLVFGWMYEVLPFGDRTALAASGDKAATSVYAWGPFHKGPESGRAVADGWTRYNFLGYEGRPAYPAYADLIDTMDGIGQDPAHGCGRAMWENNSANGEYGTTMSLMLLPHWTKGCIGSMEGLFFEATASTNYSFLTSSAVSEKASDPVRQLRYDDNDMEVGVRHMRDLGVRYLMVRTDVAKENAATADGLEFVGVSGTWDIYQVQDSEVVEPLTVEPVVVGQADDDWYKPGDDRERNLELGTSWFQNPDVWPAIPVDDGPAAWQRVTASIVQDQRIEPFDDQARKVDYVAPDGGLTPTPLSPITVSDVDIGEESVHFSVDQIGVPVLVKVSYFPNWKVEGADGPYRAGANQMIVVPTSTDVRLSYDSRTSLEWTFYLLTLIGIGLCFVWRRRGDVVHADERPRFAVRSAHDAGLDELETFRTGFSSAWSGDDVTEHVDPDDPTPVEPSAPIPFDAGDDPPDG